MTHPILGLIYSASVFGFANALLYFIITIFILVSLHEFGHFIAGRLTGMHVPVFSVGMGRRIFGFNKINGFTFGPLPAEIEEQLGVNTDYRLSLVPIGGYAKIDGMIDETQSEALPVEAQPWEFRAKVWWKRAIVISAGVIMNVLLAWGIFAVRDYSNGKDLVLTTTVGYVTNGSVSQQLGLRAGDKIVSINNKAVRSWDEVETGIMLDNLGHDFPMTVNRNGQLVTVVYRANQLGAIGDPDARDEAFGITPDGFGPPIVNAVDNTSDGRNPAMHAGLQNGDIITHVNGDSVASVQALIDHIHSSPNKPLTFEWIHNGSAVTKSITPTTQGQIGVELSNPPYTGPKQHIDYSIAQLPAQGWKDVVSTVNITVKGIGLVVSGKMSAGKAFGGPVQIAQYASQSAAAGASSFFSFMAMLSMSLALLNILPIPALDGGHLLIILIEAVIGRELPQGFKLGFQKVGIAILLCFMLFTFINDIARVL